MKTVKHLLYCLLIIMFLPGMQVFAQSLDDQLLIFRNTGVTDLLYQSNIDSIIFTCTDTAGVVYDEPIAQVFYTADTVLFVPIAEIDSVCLGSHNEIEFKNDVHILEDSQDIDWIIRFDGNNIYYKESTPADILPTVNQKLFYPSFTELFPYGLSVKVDGISHLGNEIAVSVSQVDLSEIFSKFFYAGEFENFNQEMTNAVRTRAKEIDKGETLKCTMDLYGMGSMSVDGRISIRGNVVVDLFHHYYHTDATVSLVFGSSLEISAPKIVKYENEKTFLHIPLPLVALIFKPSVDVSLFFEMASELDFKFDFDRKYTTQIEWTRKDGNQSFTRKQPVEEGSQGNTAKMQLVLDGSIFGGLCITFNFNLVGDVVGAEAKMKIGPEFNGELSTTALRDLSKNYDVSLYGAAKLGIKGKFKFEGNVTHKSLLPWEDEKKYKILEYEHILGRTEVGFFPHFIEPRAIVAPSKKKVSVAVKSDNEIAYPVESGFQIMDPKNVSIPIESVFVDVIDVEPEPVVQGIETSIDIPTNIKEKDSVIIRPVFHYAGYTIPHKNFDALTDPDIQPIIFNTVNSSNYIVSGWPYADVFKKDSTMYIVGPYIPVVVVDKVFHVISPYYHSGNTYGYIDKGDDVNILGAWTGQVDGDDISLEFFGNDSCSIYNKYLSFEDVPYYQNKPQSGCITMDTKNPIVIEVVSMTNTTLVIRFRNSIYKGRECTLYR